MFKQKNKFLLVAGDNYEDFLFQLYRYSFLGNFIKKGNKIWAHNFILKIFYELKKLENFDPFICFFCAFLRLSPKIMLQSINLGGNIKKIPIPITLQKQIVLVIKWVVLLVREEDRRITAIEMADLLSWALEYKGVSWKKKKQQHALAIENRYLLKKYYK